MLNPLRNETHIPNHLVFSSVPRKIDTDYLYRTNKEWAQKELSVFPSTLANHLFHNYTEHYTDEVYKNGASRNANIALRNTIKEIQLSTGSFPVPVENIRHDAGRKACAKNEADICYKTIINCTDLKMNAIDTLEVVQECADKWGFVPQTPPQTFLKEESETNAEYNERIAKQIAIGKLARLSDEKWWLRQIETAYKRFCEHCRIIEGKVRYGVSNYVSHNARRNYKFQQEATNKALANMVLLNDDTGEELNLLDAVNASVANPQIRRDELMTRCDGFTKTAVEMGLVCGFFTLTAPSKYHAYLKINKSTRSFSVSNKKYKNHSPRHTQRYLCKVWSRARAKLKRMDIQLFGFRIVEPHHDGTPHWHAQFYFEQAHESTILHTIADHFTRCEREELDVSESDFYDENGKVKVLTESVKLSIKKRVDYKKLDPTKGNATAYLTKYISKNIDGYGLGDSDGLPEKNTKASDNALSVRAWASLWGIRQFQQIGGAPVTVWRELRRMQNDDVKKGTEEALKIRSLLDLQAQETPLEVARIAADSSNWRMFLLAMGGVFCPRSNMPVKCSYKVKANGFDELVGKLEGLINGDETTLTRLKNWSIVKKKTFTENKITTTPCFPTGAKSGLDFDGASHAFDLVCAVDYGNGSCPPWGSVNNCTQANESSLNKRKVDARKSYQSG